mmetsp:Transcript_31712/g.69632  ORF Transcript_31712/g.69632 Transcript_31712/m.69632 type:complete len:1416 (+) Transcript_31712:195-4442(+)
MSSSRWKRFAFFDRSALSLPPEVLEDVFFPSSDSSVATGSGGGAAASAPSSGAGSGLGAAVAQEHHGGMVEGESYSLSLCKATVSLDAASVAATSVGGSLTVDEGAVVAMAKSAAAILTSSSGQGVATSVRKTKQQQLPARGAVTLALFSSRSTDGIHVADLTVRCNPPPEDGAGAGGLGYSTNSAATAAQSSASGGETSGAAADSAAAVAADGQDLDGYRGYFNPFAYGFVKIPASSDGSGAGTAGGGGGGELSRYERTIVADHMMSSDASGAEYDGRPAGSVKAKACIAGVSTCTVASLGGAGSASGSAGAAGGFGMNRLSSSAASSASSNGAPNTYLHVAAVTSAPSYTGVCVCVDPHLHLSTGASSATTGAATSAPYPPSKFYQPSTKFDTDKYGEPTGAVHSLPGLVAIGTNLGYVLVYAYDAGTATGTGSAGGRRQYGHGGTNRLSLIVEVAPPPADAVGGVSSVRLVRSVAAEAGGDGKSGSAGSRQKKKGTGSEFDRAAAATSRGGKSTSAAVAEERTRLYVTYRPAGLPSTNRPPSPRDGTLSGTSAGVCVFDLGTITASQLASAATSQSVSVGRPLARYDLDSRGVDSSALCDVVSAAAGGGSATSGGASGAESSSPSSITDHYLVARPEGLVTYSVTDKIGSVPIDGGSKVCACWVPPPATSGKRRHYVGDGATAAGDSEGGGAIAAAAKSAAATDAAGATHVLISTSDPKSGRDAVDIYDTSHKIIAFHALLSPGHRALRAVGIGGIDSSTGKPKFQSGIYTTRSDGTITAPRASYRGLPNSTAAVRSSAIVLTSGGSLVTLTERPTSKKIALLVQKNLYTAAISMAYADSNQSAVDIAELYRQYAEHLYDRGDFASAMEQYICTIGVLEPGHVVLRYLDSAKVPLLVQYLLELRERGIAGREHDELLKTCYAKLGDVASADAITSSGPAAADRSDKEAYMEIQTLMTENKAKDALALLCSLEPDVAAKCMSSPGLGPNLVHAAPRESAGIVLALCDGTYSQSGLADAATATVAGGDAAAGGDSSTAMPPPLIEGSISSSGGSGKRFPPHLFADCFVEQPKLLRLLLSTCRTRRCHLSPELKRTLLELTLDEWSGARRRGDSALERRKKAEVMDILTDPHLEGDGGIDPTEALVLCQHEEFGDGITYLYEKLGLSDMLLDRLAADGGESARRSMLAMCGTDPDVTAEVIGKLVDLACVSGEQVPNASDAHDSSLVAPGDIASSRDDVLMDLREALFLARAQRAELPPVRVVRTLAGEGTSRFTCSWKVSKPDGPPKGVPLSVALDYVGPVLDGSRDEAARLRQEIVEYSELCTEMEEEINFLRYGKPKRSERQQEETVEARIKELRDEIPLMLKKVKDAEENANVEEEERKAKQIREEYWREMSQSKDQWETITRYFAKGIIQ